MNEISRREDDDGEQPEVKLELSREGVRQVLSLYSEGTAAPVLEEPGIQLGALLHAIRRYFWLIILAAGLGALLGLLLSNQITPIYQVDARVVLSRQELAGAASSSAFGSSFVATQAEIMHSPSVVGEALKALGHSPESADYDGTLGAALEAVNASPVSGTQVIALSYLGPDAGHGADLLTGVVNAYRNSLMQSEQRNQARKLKAKQDEIDILEAEEVRLADALRDARESNAIAGNAAEAAEELSRLISEQTSRLISARNVRIELENALAAQAADSEDRGIRRLTEQLVEAEAELARVTRTLTPAHPDVEQAQREVTVLKEQLANQEEKLPTLRNREVAAARRVENELEAANVEAQRRLAAIQRFRVEEERLMSQADHAQRLADDRRRELLDQQVVMKLAESGDFGATARLIAEPVVPPDPLWPQPLILVGGGLGAGGLLGLLLALQLASRRPGYARVEPAAGGPSSV